MNTDVRRRAVLPSSNTPLAAPGQPSSAAAATSTAAPLPATEYLDQIEEDLNKRVDRDVDVLVEGMADLVKLAQIEDKDHFRVSQDAFQATCRTESMIRSAHSLLALSHTLKLLHLFSDSSAPTLARAQLAKEAREGLERARRVIHELAAVEDTQS